MLVKCTEHNTDLFGGIYKTVYVKYMTAAELVHWADVHPQSDYAKVLECYDPDCDVYPGYVVKGQL